MDESAPHGPTKPIPYGKQIVMTSHGREAQTAVVGQTAFSVIDRRLGRVALPGRDGFVFVSSDGAVSVRKQGPGTEETFQWIETFKGELTLMSLSNHRYLRVEFATGKLVVDGDWRESRQER